MTRKITKNKFKKLFKSKLKNNYERALSIFNKYDDCFSWDITIILLHAMNQNKIDDVLISLERYYKENNQCFENKNKENSENVFENKEIPFIFLQVYHDVLKI